MRSLVEYRLYQGIVDNLDFGWSPETYYTLAPSDKVPSRKVTDELLEASKPFLGVVVSNVTHLALQVEVDKILRDYEMRREILIWSNERSIPGVIDCAKVVQWGPEVYAIRPYMDRTAIMREVMESIEKRIAEAEQLYEEE